MQGVTKSYFQCRKSPLGGYEHIQSAILSPQTAIASSPLLKELLPNQELCLVGVHEIPTPVNYTNAIKNKAMGKRN